MSKQAILEAVQSWSDGDWEEVLLHAPDLSDRLRKVLLNGRIVADSWWRKVGPLLEVPTQYVASPARAETLEIEVPTGLHPETKALVARFAGALAGKLHEAEQKHGYSDGWKDPSWMDECREQLLAHVAKGDPRDVAAYSAFLWYHGEKTWVSVESAGSTITGQLWKALTADDRRIISDDYPELADALNEAAGLSE